MRDAAIAVLEKAGVRGAACVEFKMDPRNGVYQFMEFNSRTVIYNRLHRRCGLDFAAMAWAEAAGQPIGRPEPVRWPGVWVNLHADLLYSAVHGRREQLGWSEFSAPYRRPILEAVWSAADPAPFLSQCNHTLCRCLRAAFRWNRAPGLQPGSQLLETSLRRRF